MIELTIDVLSEEEMLVFAEKFAGQCPSGIIYLQGELGAGKTCFTRGVLRAFEYEGIVKSPTYTLVEPYELNRVNLYHFDLYRLENEDELLFLGCDEYFHEGNLCLIEWPSKAKGVLPSSDIEIRIEILNEGRRLQLRSFSSLGDQCLGKLKELQ